MKPERTLQILRQNVGQVVEASRDVFRVEKKLRDHLLGVFYFDFSDRLLKADFDLLRYSHDYIATDFYQHEGSLQWNYYLYFVLDREGYSCIDSKRLAAIEGDRTYARKFVREQKALESEFSQRLPEVFESQTPPPDLASVWIGKLTDAGLARVADPTAPYASTVEAFISGRSTSPISPQPTAAPSEAGRFMQSLSLERFRQYPIQKEFELGTVNLLRGVNGSGKTSFLEAVELAICGGIRRQNGKRPPNVRLRVHYAGKAAPESAPVVSDATYRARDLAWYGGYRRHGNDLCHSFARFNFFDSDAAFRLSTSDDTKEMLKALDSLLLGEQATTIEERMQQFRDRFMQLERSLARQRKLQENERNKAGEVLAELAKIKDTREALIKELQTKAAATGWQKFPAQVTVENLAVLRETVEDTATLLSQHAKRVPWLGRVSVSTLSCYVKQLDETIDKLTGQRKLTRGLRTAFEQGEKRLAETQRKFELLTRLAAYHAEPQAITTLLDIKINLETEKNAVGRLKEAATQLRGVDLTKFTKSTATVSALVEQNQAGLQKCRRSLAKLTPRMKELQEQLGAITSVVQEIKGLGQRFCELNPGSGECPLCGAGYESLAAQISRAQFGSKLEASLREMAKETNRDQLEMQQLIRSATELQHLQDAADLVLDKRRTETRSARAVVESLINIGDLQSAAKAKLDTLVASQKRLRIAGFTEDELEEIIEKLERDFALTPPRLLKQESIQSLLTETQGVLEKLREKRDEDQEAQKKIDREIQRLTNGVDDDVAVNDAEIEFERRQSTIEEILKSMHTARKSVTLADDAEFSTTEAALDMFAKAIARVQAALTRIEEKDTLEERTKAIYQRTKTELESLVPQHTRAKAAAEQLTELLGADYKTTFTRDVLAVHRERLSTIFALMHSPKEFKTVHFEPALALERHTGVQSSIAEISTGQRAALALSIFLSLNSSISSKAPWLIFDDPVVHVDDLNTLSFLDMLRDLVLLGDRQIFFSTAHSRIADLFSRKFDCLGNDFRPIPLSR